MKPAAHKRRKRIARPAFYSIRASLPQTLRENRREDSVTRRYLAGLSDWASQEVRSEATNAACWRCGAPDEIGLKKLGDSRVCWRCADALVTAVLDDEEWADDAAEESEL